MEIIITNDYMELSNYASQIVIDIIRHNPNAVLGLATGTTPLGLYERMIADHKDNGTSYAQVKAVNLDEYIGLSANHEQSYAYFMRRHLFDYIDIDLKNTYIEKGTAQNEEAECKRYDNLLKNLPRDFQLLGLGSNGHIAFNEPGTSFDSTTHVVELADTTIRDNARLFNSIDEVPRKAFTMGLKSIVQAKKILVLANGVNKADAVCRLLDGNISETLPASILHRHLDCTLIIDRAAASKCKISKRARI